MKTKNKIQYPKLSRLPNGVNFVIQDSHKECNFDKYTSFTKNGRVILIGAGNSLKKARKNTLIELNKQLLNVRLIWGEDVEFDKFTEIIA